MTMGMSTHSRILRVCEGERLTFWCPGCNGAHGIKHGPGGWTWNGDMNKPTFSPSVLVNGHKLTKDENGEWAGGWERDAAGDLIPTVCHSFIKDGHIQFLGDCTHTLAGQTVDIPAWPYTEHLFSF